MPEMTQEHGVDSADIPSRELPTVVGIGASAGGIEALSRLLRALPEKTHFSYVIAQHLSAEHPSMLTDILGRETPLPVMELEDGFAPAPNTIYITPAAANVLFEDGVFRLKETTVRGTPKPSIDLLFRSLAMDLGEQAIGIVLSGTGTDGAEGVKAIKQAGGYVLVQSLDTAKYTGMPQAAADTGAADEILPPEGIAEALTRFSEHLPMPVALSALPQNLGKHTELERMVRLVRTRTGVDLGLYKEATMLRRLQRRLQERHVASLGEYLTLLESRLEEAEALVNTLHIVVTSFFRDTEAFSALGTFIQLLVERKPTDEALRIWVAGCATGEEAYSVGMLVLEAMREQTKHLKVQIYATDVNLDALASARRGVYSSSAIELLDRALLQRYFHKVKDCYQVNQMLRELVVFAKHDVIKDPPFLHLDMVSCRNLLIYFKNDVQGRVLETFHYALRSYGYLFLGRSETTHCRERLFVTVSKPAKLYQRKPGDSSYIPPIQRLGNGGGAVSAIAIEQRSPGILERILDSLQQSYVPPGLLLDERLDIRRILGKGGQYLRHKEGQTSLNAVELIPKHLGLDLRALVAKAKRSGMPVHGRTVKYRLDTEEVAVRLVVRPLVDDGAELLYLVLFEPQHLSTPVADHSASLGPADEDSVRALEHELAATREHLQTVVQELETTNEELQSTNEELQSANEELQSTNEELETSNEELQATNEELSTVNQELQGRSEQLALVNSDLQNIKDSLPYPIIAIDNALCVKLFNQEAQRIFSLSNEDIGKNVATVQALVGVSGLVEHLDQVIRIPQPFEKQISVPGDYLMRIQPYVGTKHHGAGAILTFWDNAEIINAQKELRESENRLQQILNHSPLWDYVKDRGGRYLLINRRMLEAIGYQAAEVIGRVDEELFSPEITHIFRQADHQALTSEKVIEIEHCLHIGGREVILLASHFTLRDAAGIAYAVCMKALDITARKANEMLVNLQSQALNASANGIAITTGSDDFPIVYVNKAFSSMSGYTLEECRGRSFGFLFQALEEDQAPALASIHAGMQNGKAVHTLVRSRHKNGTMFWNELSIYPITDEHQQISHFVAVQNDVSEQVKARHELAENERRLRHAQLYAQVWSFEWDMEEDRFQSLNIANDIFGQIEAIQIPNLRSFLRLLHQDDRHSVYSAMIACRDGKADALDIEYRLHDDLLGDRWLHTRAAVDCENGRQRKLLGLTQDITERKLGELHLAAARDDAEKANRAKNEFLSRMSHELRTPLNAILGFAQLLEVDEQQSETHRDSIQEILRAGWHLLALINDILDLSRLETGRLEVQRELVDTKSVIEECISALMPTTRPRQISISKELDAGMLVWADRTRLKQVLLNIISNAIKYNRDQGTVVIRSKPGKNGNAYIIIADSGIGMSEEQTKRLFQPFERLGREMSEVDGVGIGLSLSQQLLDMMHGTVQVESTPGKGSVFTVMLPLHDDVDDAGYGGMIAPPPSVPAEAGEVPALSHDNFIKVLYIEDNPANLMVMRRLMDSHPNIALAEANTGRLGIELALATQPQLILLDLHLPDMTGFEVLKRLRAEPECTHTPIIAVSADAGVSRIKEALGIGFDDYVVKPFRLADLERAVLKFSRP